MAVDEVIITVLCNYYSLIILSFSKLENWCKIPWENLTISIVASSLNLCQVYGSSEWGGIPFSNVPAEAGLSCEKHVVFLLQTGYKN